MLHIELFDFWKLRKNTIKKVNKKHRWWMNVNGLNYGWIIDHILYVPSDLECFDWFKVVQSKPWLWSSHDHQRV